ncbi:hypothetical protein FXO38_36316 [Capsicum annuum]|uniref:Uncharacterized protein n=1 Tax=Capsicum annuum TaxID=4072 RepID=A0A2G2ZNQ5_CAPAN|nr:hypothetical protein FXO38_36316 [Capsicum annuum]PHT83628.1 hypothetical protein T459_12071 [Capsicum annuum]
MERFARTQKNLAGHQNGKVCKDPRIVQAEDFFFSGLDIAGNKSKAIGFLVTPVIIPGANTLDIVIGRVGFGDFWCIVVGTRF